MKAKNLIAILGMAMTNVVLFANTNRTPSNIYKPHILEIGGQDYEIIKTEKGYDLKPVSED